jgi:hypothetical protein
MGELKGVLDRISDQIYQDLLCSDFINHNGWVCVQFLIEVEFNLRRVSINRQ